MFNIQRPSRNLRSRLSRNRQRLRETAERLTRKQSETPNGLCSTNKKLKEQFDLALPTPLPLPEQMEAELGSLFRKYRIDIAILSYTYRHRKEIEACTLGIHIPQCTNFSNQMRIAVTEAINKLFHDS